MLELLTIFYPGACIDSIKRAMLQHRNTENELIFSKLFAWHVLFRKTRFIS
jgi:hypothetical protein